MATITLLVKHHFSAARALRDYEGQCANTHGHNFSVEVHIDTPEMDKGYALDYYEVKMFLAEISGPIDHNFLNDIEPFTTINPTTENLAKWFFEQLQPYLKDTPATLQKVIVWETPEFGASYSKT